MAKSSILSNDPWAPEQTTWGPAAFEETRNAFFQLVIESNRQQAQAFALWALAQQRDLTDAEVPAYGGGCIQARPEPIDIERAREALEISAATAQPTLLAQAPTPPTPKRKPAPKSKSGAKKARSKRLSQLEKSVLAELEEAEQLIAAYRKAEAKLAKAQAEVDAARAELGKIDPLERELIARHDPDLAALLREID